MTEPDPDVGFSGMDEEYVIMDREFYNQAVEPPFRTDLTSTQRSLYEQGSWDYGYHELAPRLEREGWYQLQVGMVPIGKRVGTTAHMICPVFRDHKISEFDGWYLIIGQEGIRPSDIGEQYGPAIEGTRQGSSILEPTYIRGTYTTDQPEGQIYYKHFPSLGAALDAVRYKEYRGMTPYSRTNEPDGWYDVWLYHWFPLIP